MSACGALNGRFGRAQPRRRLLALDGGGIRGIATPEIPDSDQLSRVGQAVSLNRPGSLV